MSELVTALGLVMVIEGVLYALFPGHARAMMEMVRATPEETLRMIGLAAMAAGVAVVWAARSLL
jgi:uncharacterized protein